MHIIEVSPTHYPQISALAHAIWPETYGEILSPQQLTYMLALFYSRAGLEKARQTGQRFLLLSTDKPIGFAGFQTNFSGDITKLHKLYILPNEQKKGYGKALFETVVRYAKEANNKKIELNVNRNNPARFFYTALGFVTLLEKDIAIGNGFYMEDYIMQFDLLP